jgi:hypothetical protein
LTKPQIAKRSTKAQ